ncbi:Hypothetical predicted protein [Paramuricea clavata]|uniref:Uncharacterized protein n=2 Tax=Paramuricea clavata TaxID=317549 RepID=A0A7D9EGW9_PARCT|nr:Hypothetical predicted protein [Paramuricea clavata]
MKRHTTAARGRKWKEAMDYNVTPTISTDYLPEEDEATSSVRTSPELNEERDLPMSEMTQHNSGSVESLDSTTDIGCSRILGDIQAGLQADINAAKVF